MSRYRLLWAAMLIMFIAGCEASNEQAARETDSLSMGYMYWAPSEEVLQKDWELVVAGTVTSVRPNHLPPLARPDAIMGEMTIEHVLHATDTGLVVGEVESAKRAKHLTGQMGFEGLQPGDKVIVFFIEYDGSIAVNPTRGSNCLIGIKVDSWDDPILDGIRTMAVREGPMARVLDDESQADQWRRFSPWTTEAIRAGKPFHSWQMPPLDEGAAKE